MSDMEEPPSKLTKFELESQYMEGDVTDEGQEEWLSDGVLTDDDFNPTLDPDRTNSNFGSSQDDTLPSTNDGSMENLVQIDIQQSVGETQELGAPVASHDEENIEETLSSLDNSNNYYNNQTELPEELNAFLVRKSDNTASQPPAGEGDQVPGREDDEGGKTGEGGERDSNVTHSEKSDEDGNDTDDLLRMLGEGEGQNKESVQEEADVCTSDDDEYIFEGAKMKTLTVAKNALIRKYPGAAARAEPEEDDDATDVSSDEGDTLTKIFGVQKSKPKLSPDSAKPSMVTVRPSAVTSRPSMITPKSPNLSTTSTNLRLIRPKFNMVSAKPNTTSAKLSTVTSKPSSMSSKPSPLSSKSSSMSSKPSPLSSNASTVSTKISNNTARRTESAKGQTAEQPNKGVTSRMVKVIEKPATSPRVSLRSKVNKNAPTKEQGHGDVTLTRGYVARTRSDVNKNAPPKAQGLGDVIEDMDIPEEKDNPLQGAKTSGEGKERQRIMHPERMEEEEISSDGVSDTDEDSLYDELPSSDSENFEEWFTLDIRAERAGDYLPLLADKAHQLLTHEKERVKTRLADLRKSLSALTDNSKLQADKLRQATVTLAELDTMLKAT